MKHKKKSILFLFGFQIMTFNAGLAPSYVPFAAERAPVIASALGNQNADVLCLQEVWVNKDQQLLKEKLKSIYPYAFSFLTSPIKSPLVPACELGNLIGQGKFLNCMVQSCFLKSEDSLTSCILKNCTQALDTLKNENKYCGQALMAQNSNPPPVAFWNILNPFKSPDLFTYESGTGVIIFSKYPFLKKDVLDLTENSTLNRRAVLTVEIQPPEFSKPISIYCTHLTANFETSVPYSGNYKSWQDENKSQIDILLSKIKTNTSPSILLGDFNCSIANKKADIDDDWQSNCHALASEMEEIELQEPKCSFCKNNSLTDNEPKNLLLDHIYVRGLNFKLAKLSLNGTYPIITPDQKTELKPLSDHYAVEAFITSEKATLQSKHRTKSGKKVF
jgi:endonuclease/exonuclease/phosphatase family metal-dependent hydrolase